MGVAVVELPGMEMLDLEIAGKEIAGMEVLGAEGACGAVVAEGIGEASEHD